MNTYFLAVVKSGKTLNIASVKANTEEEARKVVDASARAALKIDGFHLDTVDQEAFDAFHNKEKSAVASEEKEQEADKPKAKTKKKK